MLIRYKAYDLDLHRYMRSDEVSVTPGGHIFYNNHDGAGWRRYPKGAEWIRIEKVSVSDDKRDYPKRI